MPAMHGFQAGSSGYVSYFSSVARSVCGCSQSTNLTFDSGECVRENMVILKFDSFTSSAQGGRDLCVFITLLQLSLAVT